MERTIILQLSHTGPLRVTENRTHHPLFISLNMHPSVFLSALLFATSAIARPDLLRRDGTFRRNGILLNPQTGEAMSDYGGRTPIYLLSTKY